MFGGLSGEGPVHDAIIESANSDSGGGNQQHNLNPEQFEDILKGGGKGAEGAAGKAAGGAGGVAGKAAGAAAEMPVVFA